MLHVILQTMRIGLKLCAIVGKLQNATQSVIKVFSQSYLVDDENHHIVNASTKLFLK